MMNFLQGYLTYVLALIGVVIAFGGYFAGIFTGMEASTIIYIALGMFGIRRGIDNAASRAVGKYYHKG